MRSGSVGTRKWGSRPEMEISQSDIAQLSDWQLRHMVIDAASLGFEGPGSVFHLRLAAAIGRARRER
jgi:hypothetical protein